MRAAAGQTVVARDPGLAEDGDYTRSAPGKEQQTAHDRRPQKT